ncbi:MAG: LLM class F420-dependent oxidoreductase [Dehalococcoidia bacterium]
MKIGVTFPQTEIGPDAGAVRAFAQAVETAGYHHLLAFDHVLGASPANRPGWRGYTAADTFHEIFVLFGYLAAATERIELTTGVLVLPQRQTALVAKQAAEIDRLSGGRLRLGVGIGWNAVEYQALGSDFRTRGRLFEEQIAVLRALWQDDVVTFHGRWHHIEEAGINPPPIQRPIPVWIGASADAAIRRAARLADGWIPNVPGLDDETIRERVDRYRGYLREAGRELTGMDGMIRVADGDERVRARARLWRDLGATHLSLSTMGGGLARPDDHIRAIERLKPLVEDAINS